MKRVGCLWLRVALDRVFKRIHRISLAAYRRQASASR
jgi:hypothetical protein